MSREPIGISSEHGVLAATWVGGNQHGAGGEAVASWVTTSDTNGI